MSILSQALAAGDPECGSAGGSFTAASGATYARNGAPGADGTQGPAGAQGLKGDATAGPFAIGIIPAGTAFDGTHMWVVTSPNSGVIELNPDGATAGPFPAGGWPPGVPFDGIHIWVSGFNGVTELNPDGTFPGRGQATRDRVRWHPHLGVLV